MWGHLSSLGQNVAQITKAVGAQLLDAAADEERLDAADFSDGDTADCSAGEPGDVLVQKVQRLQDKLHRAREEIDRLNDIRARATESVTKTIKNKDEEINELRQLLEETRLIVSESLSPRSPSPESLSTPESSADLHVATPVIHQKIKASERVSMLTRKFHEEKRTHIAALHQIKAENAKLKDRLHTLENQVETRESKIAELEVQLAKQSEDLESHKMVIARLRSEKPPPSDRDQVASLQKTIADQASTIAGLETRCQDDLEPQLAELRSELERLKSEQALNQSSEASHDLVSLLESERTSLKKAQNDLNDLRSSSEAYLRENKLLHEKVAQLTSDLQNAAKFQACEESQESVDNLIAIKSSMKNQIDDHLRCISQLQADCRKAFADEKALQSQNAGLKQQIDTLQKKLSETARLQGEKHSSTISRINDLEEEVQYLEKDIGNKDAVIRELNAQLEHRTKQLVETESMQNTWLEQAQRDRETLSAESARLRQNLETVSAEYEARIATLQDQIRKERDTTYQAQLDLQTSKDLAADYTALQIQLRAKADECANLSEALDNLQAVLDQIQAESDSKLKEAELRLQTSLDAAEEGRLAVQELIQVTRSLNQSETAIVQLEAKLSSSRKYALQIESDNAALRHAMQQTMDRIKTFSSDENLVDRRIVNKLLVTYLERKASAEVINLMIKMLGFTEEQKRLVLESQRPKSIISSLSSLIPSPYSAEDEEADDGSPEPRSEQQNLADLWVSFLLKETGSGSRRNSVTSLPSPQQPAFSRKSSSSAKSPIRNPSINDPPRRSPANDEQSHHQSRSPRRITSPQRSLTPSS